MMALYSKQGPRIIALHDRDGSDYMAEGKLTNFSRYSLSAPWKEMKLSTLLRRFERHGPRPSPNRLVCPGSSFHGVREPAVTPLHPIT